MKKSHSSLKLCGLDSQQLYCFAMGFNKPVVKHIRSNQWDTVQFLLKLPPVVDENSELITFDVMFDGTQVFP